MPCDPFSPAPSPELRAKSGVCFLTRGVTQQWTNVFGVSQTPTSSVKNYPQSNYQTDNYGTNVQGIYATGVGHSVPSNLTASEEWFGL